MNRPISSVESPACGLLVLNGVLLQEVVRQDGDLFPPVAQRRHVDRNDVEPKEEVFTKLAIGDRLFEVAVGRRDDADVHPYVVLTAEPGELAVLEHLQQLGLERRRHLADLVKKHRAVVGELELAGLLLDRPGKGAALEAEQLRLEQFGRQRCAVHLDERLVAPERGRVQRPRHQLFAGAALAANEDGNVDVGDAIDEVLDFRHPLARAEEHRVAALGLELFTQRCHLLAELALFDRAGERHLEFGVGERLADEIRRTELHRLNHRRRAALTRHHDHRHLSIDFLQGRERVQPAHRAGHHEIENHRRRALGGVAPDGLLGVPEHHSLVSALGEEGLKEVTRRKIVVDDHDLRRRHARPVEQWQCHDGNSVHTWKV